MVRLYPIARFVLDKGLKKATLFELLREVPTGSQDRAQGGGHWEMAVRLVLRSEYLLILSRVTASHLWLPSHFASGCVITSSRMVSRRLPKAAWEKCWATCMRPA